SPGVCHRGTAHVPRRRRGRKRVRGAARDRPRGRARRVHGDGTNRRRSLGVPQRDTAREAPAAPLERAVQVVAAARRSGAVPRSTGVSPSGRRGPGGLAGGLPGSRPPGESCARPRRNDRAGGVRVIAEPVTLLTDYALAGVTGWLAWLLYGAREGRRARS